MRNYIFISYAHKDSERVLPVIKKLRESGYNVWYDDGIDPGTEWAVNIATHIEGCAYFLAFMSQAYLDSLNCREEWNFARDEQKSRFLVYIEDVKLPSEMRLRSGMIQNLFMHKYDDVEVFYSKLFAAPGIEVCRNAVQGGEAAAKEVAVEHVWGKNNTGESSKTKLPDQDWKELFEIEESDTGVTIHKYIGSESVKEIVIPSEINGKTVRKIGEKAFAGAKIERVIIPDEVEKIEDYVFYDCKNLIEVRLPEDLGIIPIGAFCGCESLSEIELPKSVDWIRCGAFRGCKNLEEIKLPEAVWNIDGEAFRECESLKQINIPEKVKLLSENPFEGCSHLSVVLYNTRTYKPFYGGLKEFLGEVQLEKAKTLSEKGRNEEAEEWYFYAAWNENVQAQYEVGRICEEKGEWKNAREWYWVAFANGNNGALEGLERTCSKEVKSGNAEALYWLGRVHELKNDMNAAMACYTAAARGEIAAAQCRLAFLALEGKGMEKSLTEAVRYYEMGVENGSEVAMFCLALLYTCGRGVERNLTKAKALYLKAIEEGHEMSSLMLDMLYNIGRYADGRNERERKMWHEKYETMTKKEYYDIELNMGRRSVHIYRVKRLCRVTEMNEMENVIFQEDPELSNDLEIAVRWAEARARQGDAVACCIFGYMCEEWLAGGRAKEWYRKAMELGEPNAEELLKRYKKSISLVGKLRRFFS